MALMERVLRTIYPPHCLICSEVVEDVGGLCATCWRETPFILGAACDLCGGPLPGEIEDGAAQCDTCLESGRVWTRGRAALTYEGTGRRLVLSLKYGDRTDLAAPAAHWMVRAGTDVLQDTPLIAPIPLHRWRLLGRRYNQAALLSQEIARIAALDHLPDLLLRQRATAPQKHMTDDQRFENLEDAMALNPRRHAQIEGRAIVLIDDVMTSGATFTVAARLCLDAGAKTVRILTLARAAQRP